MHVPARSLPWRRKATPHERALLDSWSSAPVPSTSTSSTAPQLFLVQSLGALHFVVRDERGEKHKVKVGSISRCECEKVSLTVLTPVHPCSLMEEEERQKRGKKHSSQEREEKTSPTLIHRDSPLPLPLCVHLLWVMTKVLRVPHDSPLSYQRSLTENELNDIVERRHRKSHVRQLMDAASDSRDKSRRHPVKRREREEGDVCAVCQEELQSAKPLTFCRNGCGNQLHVACMRVWAEHQVNVLHTTPTCPCCREEWIKGQQLSQVLEQLKQEEKECGPDQANLSGASSSTSRKSKVRNERRIKRRCRKCEKTILSADPLYRCATCNDWHICRTCLGPLVSSKLENSESAVEPFSLPSHRHLYVQRHNGNWITPTFRSERHIHVSSVYASLQRRELDAFDYNLLLSLDQDTHIPLYIHLARSSPGYQSSTSTYLSRPSSRLVDQPYDTKLCVWCQQRNGRKLVHLCCGDIAHEDCVSSACMYEVEQLTCPLCRHIVFPGLHNWSSSNVLKEQKVAAGQKAIASLKQDSARSSTKLLMTSGASQLKKPDIVSLPYIFSTKSLSQLAQIGDAAPHTEVQSVAAVRKHLYHRWHKTIAQSVAQQQQQWERLEITPENMLPFLVQAQSVHAHPRSAPMLTVNRRL